MSASFGFSPYSAQKNALTGLKMAKNNNNITLKRLIDELKLQLSDGVPQNVLNSIQPVIIANDPEKSTIARRRNSSGTIYTTPSDVDFYLTGLILNGANEAAVGLTVDSITVTLTNNENYIIELNVPSDANNSGGNSLNLNFGKGLKLKRNSSISCVINSTAGHASIVGFTKEVQ